MTFDAMTNSYLIIVFTFFSAYHYSPLKFETTFRLVSITVLILLRTEAAPAAKSEGCQPNHFGLGLKLWLGLGYGLTGK